jgi:AbrB family looped-hinge helix DNA binding protein
MHRDMRRKKFYGSVTVSDRGQIVIPSEARRDFGIEVGEKLLVLGDLDKGLVLTKSNFVLRMLEGTMQATRQMESMLRSEPVDTEDPEEK